MPSDRALANPLTEGPHLPLNGRRIVFSQRIAAGASGAEAARAAGYKASSAHQQAWRLLREPAVQAEIERLRGSESLRRQAELDRLLAKVEGVFAKAVRNGQCNPALRAVELESVLRDRGARSLPDGVLPADVEGDGPSGALDLDGAPLCVATSAPTAGGRESRPDPPRLALRPRSCPPGNAGR